MLVWYVFVWIVRPSSNFIPECARYRFYAHTKCGFMLFTEQRRMFVENVNKFEFSTNHVDFRWTNSVQKIWFKDWIVWCVMRVRCAYRFHSEYDELMFCHAFISSISCEKNWHQSPSKPDEWNYECDDERNLKNKPTKKIQNSRRTLQYYYCCLCRCA